MSAGNKVIPAAGSELVEVLRPSSAWQPVIGEETLSLLNTIELEEEGRERVKDEAVSILAQCNPPGEDREPQTGIVIGHIQSGKTMSFTAVAALARDNGIRIVIVITGISSPLFNQSTARLQQDLRLQSREDRKWQHFANPRLSDARTIADTLEDWMDPSVHDNERRSVLITVMKNHTHLRHLAAVLHSLKLEGVPVLVIDDEGDQAGLNTLVRQGGQSTTYRQLADLRCAMPRHTFLQYTATPQAPLLINLIDILSPRFAQLITPGDDYVGGREFFFEHANLVHTIPSDEILARDDAVTDPPESLLRAMRIFFLGAAAGVLQHGGRGNRSMMIHPSQERARHAEYFHIVEQVRQHWMAILHLPDTDADRIELLADFERAYRELSATVDEIASFGDLSGRLERAIRWTRVTQLNSARGKTPDVPWAQTYGHILVGGQAMDRGFTVKGLTVTYMPRGMGVGHADTIQQRARFFGYKRSYLGYCRIFLDGAVRDAYTKYVDHEEELREQLLSHGQSGKPLTDWKRVFFLDGALSATRDNVLFFDYTRGNFSDDWFDPKAPHDSDEATVDNRSIVQSFVSGLPKEPDQGSDKRTEMQRHLMARVRLQDAYSELLTRIRVTRPSDSQRYTGLLLQIKSYLEAHPDAVCTVFVMASGRTRERTLDPARDEVKNLFQGANYDGAEETYPGDRKIKADRELTVQIHNLRLKGTDQARDDVPAIAVWVPSDYAKDWISQLQP